MPRAVEATQPSWGTVGMLVRPERVSRMCPDGSFQCLLEIGCVSRYVAGEKRKHIVKPRPRYSPYALHVDNRAWADWGGSTSATRFVATDDGQDRRNKGVVTCLGVKCPPGNDHSNGRNPLPSGGSQGAETSARRKLRALGWVHKYDLRTSEHVICAMHRG